jgi:hypothetical protein
MSAIPYSFQEQEDTRVIPGEGRHQVGHLRASVPSAPHFSSLYRVDNTCVGANRKFAGVCSWRAILR